MRKTLTFLRRRNKRRKEAPSEHVARVGWLLLRLLQDRFIEYATYCDHFGRSTREFQRDLCKLRYIGKQHFTISRMKGGRVLLSFLDGRLSPMNVRRGDTTATLSRIAAALGGPVGRELQADADAAPSANREGFLHVREPLPTPDERLLRVFDFLKNAAAGPARVEFTYVMRGARATRRVEPYHVVVRAGRYYLVAYDLARRDWRSFALDAIDEATLRKEGTFTARIVPGRFLADRAVGWINGSQNVAVTIRLSAVVAAAVTARRWQSEQLVTLLADGGAEITLTVDDVPEAVRWSLQFGREAFVMAPAQAVAVARKMLLEIQREYAHLSLPNRIAG